MENSMDEKRDLFIKRYIEKANNALSDAKVNLENNRFNVSLNRIYYAIFYSVLEIDFP
jgi:uncharacterized protein (UPF0332 family)